MFQRTDVENLYQRNTGDAKEVGGVGGQQAGLNNPDDLKNQRRGCSPDANVKTGIKKIVLIFQEFEFQVGVAGSLLDLADSADADTVYGDL